MDLQDPRKEPHDQGKVFLPSYLLSLMGVSILGLAELPKRVLSLGVYFLGQVGSKNS